MKLRLKINGQNHLLDLGDNTPSSVTLGELKTSISDTFLFGNRDVELSFNKKDVFSGDESYIGDFGIVAGDLIYVVTRDEPLNGPALQQRRQQRPQPLEINGQGFVVVDHLNANQHNNNNSDDTSAYENLVATSDHGSLAMASSWSPEDDREVQVQASGSTPRLMSEPLVIRESTANQVPPLLQELYSSSEITCPNDALFVLLHILMMESGFCLPEEDDTPRLPRDWKRSGVYTCMYQYVVTPGVVSDCNLMAVPMGSSMIIHGLSRSVGNFKTDHLQLKTENFVRDITQESAAAAYRSLDRLTTTFKDTIGLVLQNHLATSAGYRETQGLLSLPCEVQTRLMGYLDAKSICALGQTCQQWRAVYKDNAVWKRLYLRYFTVLSDPDDTSLSSTWYEIFKNRYRRLQDSRGRLFTLDPDEDFVRPYPHGPFLPPFNPMRPFPPWFLGGEHDLNPHFGGNQQNGRQGLRMPLSLSRSLSQGQGRVGRSQGQGRVGRLTGPPYINSGFF